MQTFNYLTYLRTKWELKDEKLADFFESLAKDFYNNAKVLQNYQETIDEEEENGDN